MRFSTFIAVVLGVNLLALAGLVGWLAATDRLSRERVAQVREIFALTHAQEQAELELAAELEAQAQVRQVELARWEAVAHGPVETADRLQRSLEAEERTEQRVRRMQRTIDDLTRRLELQREQITQEQAALKADRERFDREVQAFRERAGEADFQRAVAMYEGVKPAQAKAMFQTLIDAEQTGDVVEYLAAMQPRKAASVLKEFKEPRDIVQATALVEALRLRGVSLADELATEARR